MTRTKGQTMTKTTKLICGKNIQHDASGQGHAWRTVSADEMPADTVEDIYACILDGERHCSLHVADGGEHYRW